MPKIEVWTIVYVHMISESSHCDGLWRIRPCWVDWCKKIHHSIIICICAFHFYSWFSSYIIAYRIIHPRFFHFQSQEIIVFSKTGGYNHNPHTLLIALTWRIYIWRESSAIYLCLWIIDIINFEKFHNSVSVHGKSIIIDAILVQSMENIYETYPYVTFQSIYQISHSHQVIETHIYVPNHVDMSYTITVISHAIMIRFRWDLVGILLRHRAIGSNH